jgi:AraC-like DNA-binding protein
MIVVMLGLLAEVLAGYMVFILSVWSYYLLLPLMLAGVPILYLYILSLTSENFRFSKVSFIHFIPSIIIFLINFISLTITPSDELHLLVEGKLSVSKITPILEWYIQTYNFCQVYFYNLQVVIYSVLIIIRLRFHQHNIKNYFSFTENISLQWLKLYVVVFVIFSLTEILTTIFDFKRFNPEVYSIITFLFVSYFGYAAFSQPEIYYKQEKNEEQLFGDFANSFSDENIKSNELNIEADQSKKQIFPDEQISLIADKLNELMISNKPYLNCNLSLEDLADMIEINRHIVSKVINDHFKMNFFNFVNNFRIEEAAKMLKNPKYNNLSIEGIANTVGFNSKSVFNPAFKKQIGKTPSEYRKLNF